MTKQRKTNDEELEAKRLQSFKHGAPIKSWEDAITLRKDKLKHRTVAELSFQKYFKQYIYNKVVAWTWYPEYIIRTRNAFRFADFYVQTERADTVIEIDGKYHDTKSQRQKDDVRTKELNKLGYRVCRLTNNQAFKKEFVWRFLDKRLRLYKGPKKKSTGYDGPTRFRVGGNRVVRRNNCRKEGPVINSNIKYRKVGNVWTFLPHKV